MGESLEAGELRISELADRKGHKLEEHGAGSPITTFDHGVVDKETFSIVVDGHGGWIPEIFLADMPGD